MGNLRSIYWHETNHYKNKKSPLSNTSRPASDLEQICTSLQLFQNSKILKPNALASEIAQEVRAARYRKVQERFNRKAASICKWTEY